MLSSLAGRSHYDLSWFLNGLSAGWMKIVQGQVTDAQQMFLNCVFYGLYLVKT